jgi:hypothetical protein
VVGDCRPETNRLAGRIVYRDDRDIRAAEDAFKNALRWGLNPSDKETSDIRGLIDPVAEMKFQILGLYTCLVAMTIERCPHLGANLTLIVPRRVVAQGAPHSFAITRSRLPTGCP